MAQIIKLRPKGHHQDTARSSAGKPNNSGEASFPIARNARLNTYQCSRGMRRRPIHIDTECSVLQPAKDAAAERPPTASTTSPMLVRTVIMDSDKSQSVSMSSTHGLDVGNICEMGANPAAMYSKAQTAKRLVQTQEALGLTNAAIAEKLGIASNRWSQYRTGERTIPHVILVALKDRYGVPIDWILANDPSGLPQRLYAKIRIAA